MASSGSICTSTLGLVLSAVITAAGAQQSGTVVGRVVDSATAAPRAGATTTIVASGQTATTSDQGRFAIAHVPVGDHTIQIRAFGYRTVTQAIVVRAGDTVRLEIAVVITPVMLRTMRVDAAAAERESFATRPNVGSLTLSARTMEAVPRFGEADLLRVVPLSPGVQTRNDFSTGYNVRGGESDQNLILIDNYPIYNPFHLGGLFSTFIGSTVSEIRLLTGAFPAGFGGRLSSVLDVRSAEEPRPGLHGSTEVSVLAATGSVGGSFHGGNGTWMLAGRRTYADKTIQLVSDESIPYAFRDEHAHFTYRLPKDVRLSATLYDGRDDLDGSYAEANVNRAASGGDFRFSWGNLVTGATASKSLGSSAAIPLLGWRLGDSSTIEQRVSTSRFSTSRDLGSGSETFWNSLTDNRLGGTLTAFSRRHDRAVGYEVAAYDIRYGSSAYRGSLDPSESRQRATVRTLFVDDLWRATPSLIINGGARLESMVGGQWSGISPRLAVKYLTSPTSALTIAGGRFAQWTHSVTMEDEPIRLFDYWRVSDSTAPVSNAWHVIAGHERWLSDSRFARVETFYKRYDRLVESNPGDDPAVAGDEFRAATGTSWGADLLLRQHEIGPFSGWLSYTFAVSRRRQDTVRYAPAQDRRHDVNVVASWRAKKFVGGVRLGYASGMPYTEAVAQLPRRHFDPVRNTWGTGGDRATFDDIGGLRNGARLPPTRRLDLHVQRDFFVRGAAVSPYVSVVNATNARNVLFYTYDYSKAPGTRRTVSQFPVLPSAGFSIVF